jgi:hypothetical protein
VQVLLDFVCRINDDNGYNSTFQSEKMMTSLMLVMLAVSICATSCFFKYHCNIFPMLVVGLHF